jgi:alkylation response protein AidB-like acyl-CoA dehydrogenase
VQRCKLELNNSLFDETVTLDESFQSAIESASMLRQLNAQQLEILERVDQACQELYLPEFEHYIAHKYNDQTPQILKKFGLMGLTVSTAHGGAGADSLTWALALERFGQLGLSVVTFVDVHCLLASLAIEQWGTSITGRIISPQLQKVRRF